MSEKCASVWRAAHGAIVCDLPAGHDGKHGGACDMCADQDPGWAGVSWDDETAWRQGRP